ncbi:MAG: nucleoside-diphosphate kinase [Deltaproteobacteria bacterium]|nr:nucleoside-diphosphate kinase [Deltaproteobacteria bacterium]
MKEQTLCVIKPNAVKDNNIGAIIKMIEDEGLIVKGLKMTELSDKKVSAFYEEHVGKPFFDGLKEFMTSGKVVGIVLEGEDAISRLRRVMGATNPEKADDGTIRKLFAANMTENAVHGSDSPQSAKREIAFYFDNFSILD